MLNASHVRVTTGKRLYQPVLDARFADDRSLTPRVGYDWALTRASEAWDWDSVPSLQSHAIHAARFPYSLTDGSSLGLRIEEQRANLVGNTNGRWDTVTAVGSATYSTITEDTPFGTEFHRFTLASADSGTSNRLQTDFYSLTAGLSYTFTVWIRNKGDDIVFEAANTSATDLSPTGRVIGEWEEYSYSIASQGSTTSFGRTWAYKTTTGTEQTVDVAIAQVEEGGYATTPILGAAGVTRSADVADISGSDFAAMYHPSQGTVVWEGAMPEVSLSFPWSIYYTSSTDFLGVYRAGSERWVFRAGDSSAWNIYDVDSGYVAGEYAKIALSWDGTSFITSVNGFTEQREDAGTIDSPVGLALHRRHNKVGTTTGGPFTGYTSRLRCYREKLPVALIEELTTL